MRPGREEDCMSRQTLMTWVLAGASAVALVPAAADAQGRERGGQGIPAGHLPPPGECRVWYDDRPPGRQPPPTSCGAARREAYRTDGRVIYGSDQRRDDWDRDDDKRRDRHDDKRRDRDDDKRRDRDVDWDRDGDWDRECDARDRAKGECGWDDGEDDKRRDRDDLCRDGDRDGRCDYAEGRYPRAGYPRDRRYPATLPDMVWGVIFGRGDRLAVRGVRQWLGTGTVRARYIDADRNGRPEAISWTDARGVIVQRWVDTTGDGRADRVTVYTNGRASRVIR